MRLRFCLALALLFSLAATPAVAQPTLSKVFSPDPIGPGSVTTVTFTITNNSPTPVTGISFTDMLPSVPAQMTIADPSLASTDCDLTGGGSLSAPDGGTTITLTDARLGAFSSCTVTVDVTASTPGTYTNATVMLSSSAGSSSSLPADLDVSTARPGFSKSFSPSSVSLGGRSTLTFTIDNSLNPSAVGNLDFTDNLPAGVVIADPANATTDCVNSTAPDTTLTAEAGSSVIVLDANGNTFFPGFAVLDAGSTCTVVVDVLGVGAGLQDNSTGVLLADFASAGKANDTLAVTSTRLAIRKSFLDDPTPPGGSVTLEFVLENFDRSEAATNVAFDDDLSAIAGLPGLTFDSVLSNGCGGSVAGAGGSVISFSGGTLGAESSCTIQVSLSVPGGASPGSYTNTTSAITGDVDGSPVVGNSASEDLFVEPVPLLDFEILEAGTLAPDPIVEPGDDVVYRYTITNTSTTSGAASIEFLDELTNGGPETGFLPFPVMVSLPPTPDPPCGAGSSLTLVSAGTDRQALQLQDGSLAAAPGAGSTCTFDVTVTIPSDFGSGIYTNFTEEISAVVDGATRTGEPSSDSLVVIAAPDLRKEFVDDPTAPGGTATLRFTLSQGAEAPGPATDITFTDDLAAALAGLTASLPPSPDPPCGAGSTLTGSAGDTFLTLAGGSLAPGETCEFEVVVDVPLATSPGTYTNTTSQVSATVQGLATTSPAATDDLVVSGLVFDKEFLGDPAFPGETLTLRFMIANIHPTLDASALTFTDNLNAVVTGLAATGPPTTDTCGGTLVGTTFLVYTGGMVASGDTCTIDVPILVPAAAADGEYSNITSSLSGMQGGAVTANPAVDLLEVSSERLGLEKTFTDDPVAPGDPVTLEFTLQNLDPTLPATGISFTDDLDAALTGLTFDSVISNGCGGTVGGTGTSMISVSNVALAAGASCTLRVSLTVPGGAAAGTYTNTTSAPSGTIAGFATTGQPASDDLEVVQLLDFSKSFDGPTTAGSTAILTFTITNPGADTASGLSFTDDLNAVIPGLVASSLPSPPCGAGSSISGVSLLTFNGGELAGMGGTCSFDVEVQVPAGTGAGLYTNTTSELFAFGLPVGEPATDDLEIEPPPAFSKAFSPSTIPQGGTSTLTFTIDNTASVLAATSLDFTDNLPANVVVATTPNASNGCTGGTLTATAGSGTISYTGGSVAAGASCTISVDVGSVDAGVYGNTTGDLTSSSGNSGTASDTLTVDPAPTPVFSKAFSPSTIPEGGTSTLTFTIDNSAALVPATALDFIDNLPANVVVATPPNSSNGCTGGTLTATAGAGTISYTGGSVAAGASCTISVDVGSVDAGVYVNTTGDLTSSLGNSGTASDTLTVDPAPTPVFSKAFSPSTIPEGGTSTLTFTIDNSAALVPATALDFTDNLPANVVVETPPNSFNGCTGGTLTATSGAGTISYTGGSVAAGASCTISVDVGSVTSGVYVNTTGDLTSSLGNSGTASDTLTVDPAPVPLFSKAFSPSMIPAGGTSTLTFTIDNSAALVPATALDFTDNLPAGLVVETPPGSANGCSGGVLSAPADADTISYTGGTVAAGTTCTISVDVTGDVGGAYVNTTGDLTSSLGNSGTASDTLTIGAQPLPTFDKAFAPSSIDVDGVSTLTFTIDNSASLVAATDLDFTDPLPAGTEVATPANASTTCTGGTLTAVAGSGTISYTGGTVAAGATCTVMVDVTSMSDGVYINTSGDLTSSAGNSGPASDTLTVVAGVELSKELDPNPADPGGTVELTYTLVNQSGSTTATEIEFSDDLEAVLPGLAAIALPGPDPCGPGSMVTGTSTIMLEGASLAPGASCSFTVVLEIPASTPPGDYTSVTSPVSAQFGGVPLVFEPAEAVLTVLSLLAVPTVGDLGLWLLALLLLGVGLRQIRSA